jgi:hypothetical protein
MERGFRIGPLEEAAPSSVPVQSWVRRAHARARTRIMRARMFAPPPNHRAVLARYSHRDHASELLHLISASSRRAFVTIFTVL